MRDGLACQWKPNGIDPKAHRSLQVILRASLAGKQRLHFSTQLRVAATRLVQQAGARLRLTLQRPMEQLLDLGPAFRSQGAPTRFAFRGEATLPPASDHGGQ